jgi:hypothetical protein
MLTSELTEVRSITVPEIDSRSGARRAVTGQRIEIEMEEPSSGNCGS